MAKKRAQKAMSKLSVGATVRDWALRTDELPNVPRYFETGTELTRLPGPRSLFHARADQELPGCIRELTWELGHALNAACCLQEWLFGERGRPFFSEPTEAWNFAAHMLRLPNPMRRFDELFIASQATPPTFEGRTIEAFHREAFQILHSFSKWIIRGLLDAGFRSDATPDEWPVAFDEGIREHIEFLRRRNAATPFSWFNADELRRGLNRESILAQADEVKELPKSNGGKKPAAKRKKTTSRNTDTRQLTDLQKRILACHKPKQRLLETARLADAKDRSGDWDEALVRATLKADCEHRARQSKLR